MNTNLVGERPWSPIRFGPPLETLFGSYHPPQATSHRDVGVLLCSPIGDDLIRSHRPFRHLAERLSKSGFPVLRFDYRGTGDSAGDERDPKRVRTWREDIALAIQALRDRSGAKRVSLVGLRMGATLGMLDSGSHGMDSLVLWDPFISGKTFVSESLRAHQIQTLLDPKGFALQPPEADHLGQEALGFFFSQETIQALSRLELLHQTTLPAARVLVVNTGSPSAYKPLLDHLIGLGASCEERICRGQKFLSIAPHLSGLPETALVEIQNWLESSYPELRTAAPRKNCDLVTRDQHEEDVYFGENSLFGILHSPPHSPKLADRPPILLLNAGTVHRIGPHRQSVRMAREWARQGFFVLRMDVTGVGDSPVESGTQENVTYPRRGIEDVRRAMDFLGDRLGVHRFILIGLCSGGDHAFQVSLRDWRVAGAVILNPRTFLVHDLGLVERAQESRYYQNSLLSWSKWKKLLQGEIDLARTLSKFTKGLMAQTIDWRDKRRLSPVGDVPTGLRKMVDAGIPVLLVTSVGDPGITYVDIHFQKQMKALKRLKKFRRVEFSGTNHTFTSLYSQKLVSEAIQSYFHEHHVPQSVQREVRAS